VHVKTAWRTALLGIVASGFVGAPLAHADLTGSYDGRITARKLAQPIDGAAVLSQAGGAVTGTLALAGDPASFGGAYLVTGRATAKRLKVSGVLNGAKIMWRAKIAAGTLQGVVRVRGAGRKLAGIFVLVPNGPAANGTPCDAVFTQNQTLFVDDVLGKALVSCTACHVAGGQAQATRFRVTPGDALATARSIAPLIDAADPAASRILGKSTATLPHGGGQQILPRSTQEQSLRQWADLIAQAHCN
jgi:hypothetical protein